MKVVVTICGRRKKPDEGLLPAWQRYMSGHVAAARTLATEHSLPLYILSGVYGFISGDELIPAYDHLLTPEEIGALASKVKSQLVAAGVSEIDFYVQDNPNWIPYRQTLEHAAQELNIPIGLHLLGQSK